MLTAKRRFLGAAIVIAAMGPGLIACGHSEAPPKVADGKLRHASVLVNQGVGVKSTSFPAEALAPV